MSESAKMDSIREYIKSGIARCEFEKRKAATEIVRQQGRIDVFDDQITTLKMLLDNLDAEEKEVSGNE